MRITTRLVALGTCVPAAALIGMSATATADTRPEAYILHYHSNINEPCTATGTADTRDTGVLSISETPSLHEMNVIVFIPGLGVNSPGGTYHAGIRCQPKLADLGAASEFVTDARSGAGGRSFSFVLPQQISGQYYVQVYCVANCKGDKGGYHSAGPFMHTGPW